MEPYLTCLDNMYGARLSLCKFRCNNTKIPKVTGRYRNIPRNRRFCELCDENRLGDEYHVFLECKNADIAKMRKKYIPDVYYVHPNMHKCVLLLKCQDVDVIRKLGLFLKNVLVMFKWLIVYSFLFCKPCKNYYC